MDGDMAEQEQNRSEDATPYKLQEAQKRGQVAKSQEANFVAVLAAFTLTLYAAGAAMSHDVLALAQSIFVQAGRLEWSVGGVSAWFRDIASLALIAITPLLLAVAIAAIAINLAQVGPIFSFKPVTPDFDRLNLANGFKRLFSLRLVYEAFKSVLKLAIVSLVFWLALLQLLPMFLNLLNVDPRGHAQVAMGSVAPLCFKLLMILLVIALIDVIYTRREFAKNMRMSRREVTEEHKQREGDPRIRSRIRQLRMELFKRSRSVSKLPGADVLLTNPTHLAVAISYKHGEMPAPKVLAKGVGEVAAKMRAVARMHRIPVIENRPLARELYRRTDADEFVPEDLYPQVAKILLWVFSMREARHKGVPA
jgi:flagellar biosynthetic protein FlhB